MAKKVKVSDLVRHFQLEIVAWRGRLETQYYRG